MRPAVYSVIDWGGERSSPRIDRRNRERKQLHLSLPTPAVDPDRGEAMGGSGAPILLGRSGSATAAGRTGSCPLPIRGARRAGRICGVVAGGFHTAVSVFRCRREDRAAAAPRFFYLLCRRQDPAAPAGSSPIASSQQPALRSAPPPLQVLSSPISFVDPDPNVIFPFVFFLFCCLRFFSPVADP
ncbi:hypothetical protein BRADI_1g63685v3 [Brachypodium distachyon]|uniref:Uncharacterized protein n=1 Tax=Brachypodium distachyon TaxID=15368 RepID=A0A0Q3SAB5_BRADI|nr:hypothetical protein BRADI_1g63685v3 [Brachypodium distachyon]